MIQPTDPNVKKLHDWIDEHRDEIVTSLQGVLRIRSLEDEPAPGAPFGLPVREALDYTLHLSKELGFRTKDVGGYAGHAEFGAGEEMVAVLGHLDVVPEGDRWSFPPYGATIHEGYIYARGASDDKGPTYAGLFAAKALMDSGLLLRRRVRVVFGCNEESGFGCVKYYWGVAKEERPLYAFTPDAGFPLIYAEKGIADLILEYPLKRDTDQLHLVNASGGRRPNIVPDAAEAVLEGGLEQRAAAIKKLEKHWDRNVTFEQRRSQIVVNAIGKSAHGAMPDLGDNAVGRLARALGELDIAGRDTWVKWLAETAETTGAKLGIAHSDEVAGALTSNLGVLAADDKTIKVTYNVRYPVLWSGAELVAALKTVIEPEGWMLASSSDAPPLYVALDQEPVKTLLRVYQEESGDFVSKPETIGGGTYARATPNAVAFGAAFPGGGDGPAHEPDERIGIDSLIAATKIFAHALYELAK